MTGWLRNSDGFQRLVVSHGVSNVGDGISSVAFPWMVATLIPDPLIVALAAMAGRLPWVLVGLPLGVWIDRQKSAKQVIVAMNILQSLVTGAIALVVWAVVRRDIAPEIGAWILIGAMFALGVAEIARDVSAQTTAPCSS